MSDKVIAAFLSGMGIAILPSFIAGANYGDWVIYPLVAISLSSLMLSYYFDKKAEAQE